jgi:hypothetical protein
VSRACQPSTIVIGWTPSRAVPLYERLGHYDEAVDAQGRYAIQLNLGPEDGEGGVPQVV